MFQQAGYRVFVTDDVPRFHFDPSLCKMSRRLTLLEPKCRERTPRMDRTERGFRPPSTAYCGRDRRGGAAHLRLLP